MKIIRASVKPPMIDLFLAILLICVAVSWTLIGCSPAPVVTQAEFDALTTGDTLAQVQAKIGDTGTKVSEAGEIQIWQWSNAGGSNALITFGPDGMTSKAQAGLK
jgi:hypothetical protein